MNNIRNMILALAAFLPLVMVSCTPQEEYTPGQPDVEGCFEVHFPSQNATSRTFTLEPQDSRRVRISVSRVVPDGDITVPFEVTGDDIFEVEDIKFEDGQENASFYVNFPTAELGKKYTCTIEVNDPLYVSNYRLKANYITFSVLIASWDEIGEATYIDYSFTNTQTGEPMTTKTKVYRNSNDNMLYRVNDPYTEFMTSMGGTIGTRPDAYFQFRVLERGSSFVAYDGAAEVTIPVNDLIHYEPINIAYSISQYGDAYYYHPSLLSGYEDPMTWMDNRVLNWQDDSRTKPGVVQIAPSMYFPKVGGYEPSVAVKIVFPGAKLTDYTLKVQAGLPEEGKVPVKMTFTEDLVKVKYAVFEGEILESKIQGKINDIVNGMVGSKSITEAGDYTISDLKKTGKYTLVAVGYNAAGENVSSAYTVFGYLKAGDTNPVVIDCGLIVSDKYAPEGFTSRNSAEFYIYGSDITEFCYGLYRKKDFEEKYESVVNDLMRVKGTAEELAAVNGNGFTDVFIRLNSGMEYVLVVYATNGYESKIVSSSAKLAGEINPLQMTYDLEMLRPAQSKADYCGEWEFWTGTPEYNGRVKVGPLTIADAGSEMLPVDKEDPDKGEIEVQYINVTGFWKPAVDEDFLRDDTMKWEYYEGAIVPLHGKVGDYVNPGNGERLSLEMISFFMSGRGGYADGAVCGAFTDEGNIAFVDMETGNFAEEGPWWFTALGVFDSKGNYINELLSYDEMMFIAPGNEPSEEDKTSAAEKLRQVKVEFQKKYNFVELKQFQLYRAIDNIFGNSNVKSYDDKAGFKRELRNAPVNCSMEPAPHRSAASFGPSADIEPKVLIRK